MFTVKTYSNDGFRECLYSAQSLTILRHGTIVEITLHQKNSSDDSRVDIVDSGKAIIENAAGKTTEIITPSPIAA